MSVPHTAKDARRFAWADRSELPYPFLGTGIDANTTRQHSCVSAIVIP